MVELYCMCTYDEYRRKQTSSKADYRRKLTLEVFEHQIHHAYRKGLTAKRKASDQMFKAMPCADANNDNRLFITHKQICHSQVSVKLLGGSYQHWDDVRVTSKCRSVFFISRVQRACNRVILMLQIKKSVIRRSIFEICSQFLHRIRAIVLFTHLAGSSNLHSLCFGSQLGTGELEGFCVSGVQVQATSPATVT